MPCKPLNVSISFPSRWVAEPHLITWPGLVAAVTAVKLPEPPVLILIVGNQFLYFIPADKTGPIILPGTTTLLWSLVRQRLAGLQRLLYVLTALA